MGKNIGDTRMAIAFEISFALWMMMGCAAMEVVQFAQF
jgi:hypothetical protein